MNILRSCLLIDDDTDDQEIFLAAARQIEPHLVCMIEDDPEHALETLQASHELPDLILLDVNMPKMNGFEFLINLKLDQRLKHIRVIFCSTTSEKSQIGKAASLGAAGFITKPIRLLICVKF